MSNKSGVSQQVVSLPSGGGAISGMGEKFSPDLHTGTGNFTIPITLPAGRNGFQPELNLVYTTGGGNSAFGLGWDLSIPGVTRKTSGGVPKYDDVNDVLILSGAEDLVPVAVAGNRTQYRPRTEGLYAIIERELDANNDYWEVKSRDGLISVYGTSGSRGADPATIHDPEAPSKVCSWKLTETRDPLGNKIVYEYERDLQETETRHWNQLYLSRIRYVDYEDDLGHEKSLVHVSFEYEERPDPFSTYRSGFEVRTTRRCTRITIETDTDQVRRSRSYELRYDNTHLNGVSLLCEIQSIGHDGVDTEPFPPVSFGYTDFNIDERDLFPIFGTDLPTSSLANSDMELVDLFGNGLPDIIQMNGTIRYWRNLGEGRFDVPRLMHNGPAGITLGDPGVQMLDANGDGKADLMVNQIGLSGYYPLTFAGEWDRRSFKRYKVAPSFDLGDPEVKLVDLDGDGVTDAIRSGSRMECFFNDAHEGWSSTLLVERESIETFPSVNFSDPRVKLADVTGDGLQDVMMVYDGNIEYWPYMGYGKWGKRIHMANSSRFPYGYDPKRVLVGDVDGDGLADIVYVDHCRVFLWINQSGNGWSDPIEINGTPPVSDMDAVRLVDLLGSGISGVLWSTDATSISRSHMHFLDFTGGLKPYLLSVMDNNIGAVTQVSYRSSTEHYLAAQQDRRTQWKTSLPFPVQVLSRVEIIDAFSGGKLTSEYKYHHGCWDGGEREFRGFGRTDRYDTEVFEEYNAAGLHCVDTEFETVEETHFSPPTLTKRWFHQGALGDEFGDWYEADYSDEYWSEDPQKLERPPDMTAFINGLERRVKRDALRALRGTTLRMELYALDGTDREDRPYTVTESLSGIREDFPPDLVAEPDRSHIFFPHPLAQRTTQWERGDDPVTRFTFTEDYDAYGQSLRQTRIACPRGWRDLSDTLGEPFLATRDVVVYAVPVDPSVYIVNRLAKATNYEIINDGTQALLDIKDIPDGSAALSIIGQSLNFYDGDAFVGRGFGEVGEYGALVRTENLVLTEEILHDAYRSGDTVLPSPEEPPYLKTDGPPAWSAEYPNGFRDRMPPLAGYTFQSGEAGSEYARGYFTATLRRGYDFHYGSKGKGLVLTDRDPLGNDITIHYDDFDNCQLLPSRVTEANGLETVARYDYRVLRAREITSPNENRTAYIYTPTGLLKTVSAMGKATENVGDTRDEASLRYVYDFMAFVDTGQPVSVRIIKRAYHVNDTDIPLPERDATIESMHYSDGFGRLLQSRTQAEDLTFGDPVFGDAGLGPDQSQPVDDAVGQLRGAGGPVRVVVSGWQIHDNKGRVVEKYEPFFSEGWEYAQPADEQKGQKVSIYYDPLEREIRRVFPDNSERLTVQGTPADLADPLLYTPTPWEIYTYDPNDNAGRTHAAESTSYQSHWNTPTSVRLDALNRQIETILRNGPDESTDWYRTAADYDIQGNLLTIRDPLDRATSQNIYDLKGNLLRTQSIDAGTKRVVLNAAAKVAEQRDSKGALILNAYDEVSRPIRKWARDKDGEQVALREHLIYGDGADSGLTPAQAASNNLLGNIYRHYDEAGLLELPRYDFKGNILEKSRRVISDASVLSVFTPAPIDWQVLAFRVDWQPSGGMDLDTYADTLLDAKVYQTSFKYDALNRLKSMLYPEDVDGERKELIPRYNRAGALEGVELDSDVYVEHIAYNAKGQRTLAAYGNGVMTRYAYDPQTFHLARLRTERYTRPDPLTYHPTGSALQDMAYDYDLRGNMLALHHRTPGSGTQAEPERLDREFTYDPIYRLLTATGRECDLPVSDPPWQDSPRCVDITRTRPYIERYQYDAVGNLEELRHQISGGGFRRVFDLVPGTNQLARVTANGNTFDFAFDENGNLTGEGLSRHMEWDHSDRLRTYRTQMGNSEPSVYTHYLYDSSGRRVKKITRKQGGRLEISVYIDDMLEYRRDQDGGSVIENNILHIMDSEKRVALLRVGSAFPGDSGPATQYHLGDHLSSSNLVINDSGAWINREEFTPYGETSFGSFAQKRYRFTGKERDEESGLYYHFRRYYAPWLGRWMSCDPNQMANGMNLYAYVYGNPMGLTDEQGTNEEELSAEEIAAGVCDPELNANHCEIPDENLGMDYPQSIPAPETSAPAPLRSSSESPVRSETDVGPDAFCPLDMAQSTPESFPSLEEIVGSCDPADQCCPESAPAPETGTERLPTTPPSSDQPRSDPNIMMSTEGSSAGGPDPLDPAGPGGHDQPRPETEEKHEEGEGRRRRDRGRESGDRRRRAPRRRPDGWQGPWPPPVWPPPEESSETETSSSRVGFWLGVGLIVVGSVVIVATIAEDFFTLGGGLADDPVTMTAGGAMISRGAGGL